MLRLRLRHATATATPCYGYGYAMLRLRLRHTTATATPCYGYGYAMLRLRLSHATATATPCYGYGYVSGVGTGLDYAFATEMKSWLWVTKIWSDWLSTVGMNKIYWLTQKNLLQKVYFINGICASVCARVCTNVYVHHHKRVYMLPLLDALVSVMHIYVHVYA
jgi:hypothetical protein